MWEDSYSGRSENPLFAWVACAALLIVFLFLAHRAFYTHSAGFEEMRQVGAGWSSRSGEQALDSGQPRVGSFFLALPVTAASLKKNPNAKIATADDAGQALLSGGYGLRNLIRARWISLLFGAALGWCVFAWATKLWGAIGGIFSLLLYVFTPAFSGYASLATTDMMSVAFGFFSAFNLWLCYRHPTRRRAILSVVFIALSISSHRIGASAGFVWICLCALGVFFGGGFFPFWRSGLYAGPSKVWSTMAINYIAVVSLAIVLTWMALSIGELGSVAAYVRSLGSGLSGATRTGPIFFQGSYSEFGFFAAPVLALLLKTPIVVLAMSLLGFYMVRRERHYDAAFLGVAVCASLLFATAFGRTGHLTELLPVLPYLIVLAGAVCQSPAPLRLPYGVLAVGAAAWVAMAGLSSCPDFFAYGNFIAGGADGTARKFDAADRDRGRDLFTLERYARENRRNPVAVYYPSVAQVRRLDPSRQRDLSPVPDEMYFPNPGAYIVGISALQNPGMAASDGLRFHWMEDYKPERQLGEGLWVYRFAAADGKPCEFDDVLGANRVDEQFLWRNNEPRLTRMLHSNPANRSAGKALGMGSYKKALAFIDTKDYQRAVQELLAARSAGVRPLEVALGLAESNRALNRPEALQEEIDIIRFHDSDNAMAASHEQWLRTRRGTATAFPPIGEAAADRAAAAQAAPGMAVDIQAASESRSTRPASSGITAPSGRPPAPSTAPALPAATPAPAPAQRENDAPKRPLLTAEVMKWDLQTLRGETAR